MSLTTNYVCDLCGAFCHDDLGRLIQFGEASIAELVLLPQVNPDLLLLLLAAAIIWSL